MHRIIEFHEATDQPINVEYERDMFEFRTRLIKEECAELIEALEFLPAFDDDPVARKKALGEVLKEMCDVMYVIKGTAIALGWDLEEAFDRVCKNNMTKTINVKKHPLTGKILKPANYKKCNLEDLV